MKGKGKKISVKERLASFKAKVYKWLMQLATRRGYRKAITYGWGYSDLLKAWRCGDIIFGDLLKIRDQVCLFRGMNKYGGPGQAHYAMAGCPTPEFQTPTPWDRKLFFSFDVGMFPPWSKVGHRGPEEWKEMLNYPGNKEEWEAAHNQPEAAACPG